MRYFLIGFMGSGKSYWARRWGRLHDLPWLDLDREIEKHAQCTIAEYFTAQGEEAFRRLEHETLRSLGKQTSFILACGGGTPCHFDNMGWMNENGVTIFLETPVDVLLSRLQPEHRKRPLLEGLQGEELRGHIESLLDQRMSCYRKAAVILPFDQTGDDTFAAIVRQYA